MWRAALIWGLVGGSLGVLGIAALFLLRPEPPPVPIAVETPRSAPPEAPALQDMACWFPVPSQHEARCGVLTVPEDWNAAAPDRRLGLRFVVFKGSGARSDPMVYVSGGPGEPAGIDAASIASWWSWIEREDWLKSRDLVVFDQRGVGLSEPAMSCPDLSGAARQVFGGAPTPDESDAIWARAAAQCHDRLAASGIDLRRYDTTAIAADLRSLLSHLHYGAWNLLATSYGTRVALRLAATSEAGLRSMILDSVDPPDLPDYRDGAASAARAFAQLFADCAGDRSCHAAYPDLAATFERVVRRAALKPLTVEMADAAGGPLTVRLDDGKLIEVLLDSFYDWRRLGELPAIVAALGKGATEPLRPLIRDTLANYAAEGVSHGLFLSVECREEFPFTSRQDVDSAAREAPLFRSFALATLPLAACPAWRSGAATAAERAPVRSDVPTLILAGALDPVTPPQSAKLAAAHLPHGFAIEFRGVGHGVLAAHECGGRVVADFLNDPSKMPANACILMLGPPRFRNAAGGQER